MKKITKGLVKKDIKIDVTDLKTPSSKDIIPTQKEEEDLQIHLNITLQRFIASYMDATGYTFPTIITMTKMLVDNYVEGYEKQMSKFLEDPKAFKEELKKDYEKLAEGV